MRVVGILLLRRVRAESWSACELLINRLANSTNKSEPPGVGYTRMQTGVVAQS